MSVGGDRRGEGVEVEPKGPVDGDGAHLIGAEARDAGGLEHRVVDELGDVDHAVVEVVA